MEACNVETGVVRGDGQFLNFKEGMVEVRLEDGVRLKVVGEDESWTALTRRPGGMSWWGSSGVNGPSSWFHRLHI